MSELVAALAKVQAELPSVGKTKTAKVVGKTQDGRPFDYSYKYADLADVAAAIHPLLSAAGLAFIAAPQFTGGKYVLVGTLEHSSGEKRAAVFPITGVKPQEIGSSITYGRRYLLCALTGVVADEDDDGRAAQHTPAEKRPQRRSKPVPDIREPLWADIKTAREQKGWSSDDVAQDFALWSKTDEHPEGKKLMQATADELQAYLLTLTAEQA